MKKLLTEWRKFLKEEESPEIPPMVESLAQMFLSSPSHAIFTLKSLENEEMSMYLGHDFNRIAKEIKEFGKDIESMVHEGRRGLLDTAGALTRMGNYMEQSAWQSNSLFEPAEIREFVEPLYKLSNQAYLSAHPQYPAITPAQITESPEYLHLQDMLRGLK